MSERSTETVQESPENPRWMLIAVGLMGAHQVQSLLAEPGERNFRLATISIAALMPLTMRLPRRGRGALWMLVGVGPLFGAFAGHLVPIMRSRRVPPATETAPLNLAGAALLIALGVALVRSPTGGDAAPQGGGGPD